MDTAGYDDRYSKRKNVSEFGVNYQGMSSPFYLDNMTSTSRRISFQRLFDASGILVFNFLPVMLLLQCL